MQAYVYTDKSLERYAGRFVWLSVNTEDAKNAAFLKKWPIPALPTILVLDSKRDAVTLRHIGGATVPQLKKLLDDADRTYRNRGQSAADKALAKADRLAAEGKQEEAVKAFEEAMANAPKSWSSYSRAAESLLFGYAMTGKVDRCIEQVAIIYPRVKGTTSAATVALNGLSCAIELPEDRPNRVATIEKYEKLTREVFADPKIEMADDDRSGFYIAFIETRHALKDEEGAKKLIAEWAAFLEGAAARAKTPQQRTVYDSHMVSAFTQAGTPEKALPYLEQSERDFPDEYNPPARLAAIHRAMKQYDKALAATDRALAKATGPRRLQVLLTRSDIYNDMGDKKAARETLQEAIEFAKGLPEGQRSERRIASIEKKLQSIQ